jgi:hypothetical protein
MTDADLAQFEILDSDLARDARDERAGKTKEDPSDPTDNQTLTCGLFFRTLYGTFYRKFLRPTLLTYKYRIGESRARITALEDRLATLEVRSATRIEELEKRVTNAESKGLEYVGIWQPDSHYNRGDVVSYKGCMWVCKQATKRWPGESRDWQMCVRAGRDGKDPK